MDAFWVVTLFHFLPSKSEKISIEALAINDFEAMGIEEFSLDEAEVDALLGDRSYSGGDLPQEVLDEVEERVLQGQVNFRFFFSNEMSAAGFYKKMRNEVLCESQMEKCQSEDWNAEWKKHYTPIKVNDLFEIIPSWDKDFKSQSAQQIFIYPGMGFGTGSHETTFLCLKLFTEVVALGKIKSVLDFGSGSGILGLSVFKFFPEAEVDFYDIDPEANKNCYQNAQANELERFSFRLLLPQVRTSLLKEYDLVFANILEGVLIDERDNLIGHTKVNGSIIVSGLLKHQADGIMKNYSEKGLKLISHLKKGDWCALLFRKERP